MLCWHFGLLKTLIQYVVALEFKYRLTSKMAILGREHTA